MDTAPIMMLRKDMSKGSYEIKNKWLLPDGYMLRLPLWKNNTEQVYEALDANPWESRSEQAFWIGQSTSIDWNTFPKLRLANYYVYEGEFSLLNDEFWQTYR